MFLPECVLVLIALSCGAGTFSDGFYPLFSGQICPMFTPMFTTQALDKLVADHQRVRRALQLWNNNICFIRTAHPRFDDLGFFIYEVILPVHIRAGEKYKMSFQDL